MAAGDEAMILRWRQVCAAAIAKRTEPREAHS
jgi:hypothetical protein